MSDFFITILLPQHNMNYEGKTKRKRRLKPSGNTYQQDMLPTIHFSKESFIMNCNCNGGFGGGNCCWIIIILIVLFFCCGNGCNGGNICGSGC